MRGCKPGLRIPGTEKDGTGGVLSEPGVPVLRLPRPVSDWTKGVQPEPRVPGTNW